MTARETIEAERERVRHLTDQADRAGRYNEADLHRHQGLGLTFALGVLAAEHDAARLRIIPVDDDVTADLGDPAFKAWP